MEKIPDKIYKYVDIGTLKIILTEHTLKFSRPDDFNDPFDCDIDLINFDFNENINPQVEKEIKIIKELYKDNDDVANTSEVFWQDVYRNSQKDKRNSCRISCFSLKNDSVLMWSHYADKHKGACLEFNNTLEKPFVNLSNEEISEGIVSYEAHKKINYMSEDRLSAVYKLFFNKSESWSNEFEYRMITLNNKDDIQKFNPFFLSAIYFGIKVSEDQVKSFISFISENYPSCKHIKYYKGIKESLSVKFKSIE